MKKKIYNTVVFIILFSNIAFTQSTEPIIFETSEYQINFPNKFEKSSQTIPSNLGQLVMTINSYEPKNNIGDSNHIYMIIETAYPDSTVHSDKKEILEDFFEASINGAVKNVNGKLITQTKGLTGVYPNRTIEIDYQKGIAIIKMKMILYKSKMIIIQTITNTQNYPNSSATNFIDSFKLK